MFSVTPWARAGAIAVALVLLAHSSAFAHAVCGNRIFPATLAIDDPGVNDELALPTLAYTPSNSDGARELDGSFSYTKTIIPNLGLSVSDGKTWLNPGGNGWGNVDTELKYMFSCDASHEFMASVGYGRHLGQYRHIRFFGPVQHLFASDRHRQRLR